MGLAVALLMLARITVETASSAEIKVVVPNALENVEGDSLGGFAYTGGTRYQEIIPASEFQIVPETYRTITGFYLRPDRTVTAPQTATIEHLELRLSTISTSPTDVDVIFANNVGSDVATVYEGFLSFSTQATGPPDGPRGFDYFVPFQTPFVYDHASGRNLVLDAIIFDNTAYLQDATSTDLPRAVLGDPAAGSGQLSSDATVWQFVFVPEPSSLLMGAFGLFGMVCLRMRRQLRV